MRGQKGRHVVFVVTVFFGETVKEVFHSLGIKPGVHEAREPRAVGFAFGVAGEFELFLQQCALCTHGNRHRGVPSGTSARFGGENGEKNGAQGDRE